LQCAGLVLCAAERNKVKSKSKSSLAPRLRILAGKNIAFGPGKAELLALLAETGSIGKAANRMGMSYMRAWSLIRTMNQSFKNPLVSAAHGGRGGGGGAKLTETGRKVLGLYRQMERASLRAIAPSWKQLQTFLPD
jgi:molybdate transport system regulatory protein